MKWMVTGANGQVGSLAVQYLHKFPTEVFSFTSQELDITDEKSVISTLDLIKPDVILNAAAWTDVDGAEKFGELSYKVNALGPQILARHARIHNSKLIYISTDYVFDGSSNSPIAENHAPNPINFYGFTKSEGEKLAVTEYPEGVYILRTAWLYSNSGKNFVKSIIAKSRQSDETFGVVADQFGQPTTVSDFIAKMYELIDKQVKPGIYHLTNTGLTTWFGFAQQILELNGMDSNKVMPISSQEIKRMAERPRYSVLGHANLIKSGIQPMREWSAALRIEMPGILENMGVKREI
jgi:dTDP-4-dehydrorhamnose reductase